MGGSHLAPTDWVRHYAAFGTARLFGDGGALWTQRNTAVTRCLKGKGGSIKELVELENQILDLRRQIHNLGIKLGEFAEDSEFCTVKVTLAENTERAAAAIPIWHRAKTALGDWC